MEGTHARKQNVFSPRQSRYIKIGSELRVCLDEMYPYASTAGYNFNIQHVNDRWVFDAPEELSEVQKRNLANRIADLRTQKEEENDHRDG